MLGNSANLAEVCALGIVYKCIMVSMAHFIFLPYSCLIFSNSLKHQEPTLITDVQTGGSTQRM